MEPNKYHLHSTSKYSEFFPVSIRLWILFRIFLGDYLKWYFLEKIFMASSRDYSIPMFGTERQTIFGELWELFKDHQNMDLI